MSAGHCTPVVNCEQWNTDKGFIGLQANTDNERDNNIITSTWNFTSRNRLNDIICSTKFQLSSIERSKESSATCISNYDVRSCGKI